MKRIPESCPECGKPMKWKKGVLHYSDFMDVPNAEWEECTRHDKPERLLPPETCDKIEAVRKKWFKVGEIGVDAGLCWLGDPGYVITPDAKWKPAKSWSEFCDKLWKREKDGVAQWDKQTGVTVSTGDGDGLYPVYVRRSGYDGRIDAALVDFVGIIKPNMIAKEPKGHKGKGWQLHRCARGHRMRVGEPFCQECHREIQRSMRLAKAMLDGLKKKKRK